jgi:hypothetical protein
LKQQTSPQNNPAFVLGNGTSRLKLNHNTLLTKGTVYGCNALYREFSPHFLIAVDVKMVNEIVSAGYHKKHPVWTNHNKGIINKNYLNFFNPHKGWSSGPTALWFAASQGHAHIFIFGFDYQGLNGKLNNVYADTFNYKKSTDSATFHGNWLNQTEKVIKDFKNTFFYRVVDSKAYVPNQLNLENLSHISFEEFEKYFPDTIYSDQINQNTTI